MALIGRLHLSSDESTLGRHGLLDIPGPRSIYCTNRVFYLRIYLEMFCLKQATVNDKMQLFLSVYGLRYNTGCILVHYNTKLRVYSSWVYI